MQVQSVTIQMFQMRKGSNFNTLSEKSRQTPFDQRPSSQKLNDIIKKSNTQNLQDVSPYHAQGMEEFRGSLRSKVDSISNANSDLKFHLPGSEDFESNLIVLPVQSRRASRVVLNKSNSQLAQQDMQMIQSKVNNLVLPITPRKSDIDVKPKDELKSILSSDRHKTRKQRKQSVANKNKNGFQKMTDQQVIEVLVEACESRVTFFDDAPANLDSTDSLDSLLMALFKLNQDYVTDCNSPVVQEIHLATGNRTVLCRQILASIVHHQYKESLLHDSVDFFQESLKKMVIVTESNNNRQIQIEELEGIRQDLTMKMFDYQKKLTDTSTNLLKLRQKDFEGTKIIESMKKKLEFKTAECESLSYMLQNNQVAVDSNNETLKADTSKPSRHQSTPFTPQQYADLPLDQNMPLVQGQDDLTSMQELIQKQNIHLNKYLQQIMQLQTQLESKDRLINHLENNVSNMLVDREENAIKLKSEIVLLQTKLNDGEDTFNKRLLSMKSRVEVEEKKKLQVVIDELNQKIENLKITNHDQVSRIHRLQNDYDGLQVEFNSYRTEKIHQESVRQGYLEEIDGKYQQLSQSHTEVKRKSSEEIADLQYQLKSRQNEAEMATLRLKYLRQCTESIHKQKIFIMETLKKCKQELNQQMDQIQESMITQNKQKSYLISVEKAIKQTRNMQELGMNSLKDLEQIIGFFKTEKMYELVFQHQPSDTVATIDARVEPAVSEQSNLQDVQRMLDTIKNKIEIPINFKPRIQLLSPKKVVKNEEYYLEHCPIELVSILLKFIVEQLFELEVLQSVEQIPFCISRILYLANGKSDLDIEKEIFQNYLQPVKKIIDDEYQHLQDQVITKNQIQKIEPEKPQVDRQVLDNQTQMSNRSSSQKKTYNVLSMEAFEDKREEQAKKVEYELVLDDLQKSIKNQEFQMKKLQLQYQEHKLKSKEMQKALAQKIVVLQETNEQLKQDNETNLNNAEAEYNRQLEKLKEGCRRREQALIDKIESLKQMANQSFKQIEQKNQEMKNLRHAKEVPKNIGMHLMNRELIKNLGNTHSQGSDNSVSLVQMKLSNMQHNISAYIDIKESNRTNISLAFVASDSNQSMINDKVIGFYLEKVFQLPKQKFNFLSLFDYFDEFNDKKMTQVNVAIMMEYQDIQTKVFNVKSAVQDGSSLLYDLQPLYISFHQGCSGLATHHKIKDYSLVTKIGKQLGNSEFLVSLLRHQHLPTVFMVIAFDFKNGGEYVVELLEEDMYQLCSGDYGLLDDDSVQEIQELIFDCLTLIEVENGQKLLTCEQRIYFNTTWQEAFVPKIQRDKQKSLANYDLHLSSDQIKTNSYQKSALRENLINQEILPMSPKAVKVNLLYKDQETQADDKSHEENFTIAYQHSLQVTEYVKLEITAKRTQDDSIVLGFLEREHQKNIQIYIQNDDEHFVQFKCMTLQEQHMLLICVERAQGYCIKIHDLKDKQSHQVFLSQKSNGEFSAVGHQQMMKDDFREILFNLAFDQVSNNFTKQTISAAQQKLLQLGHAQDDIFRKPETPILKKIQNFQTAALQLDLSVQARYSQQVYYEKYLQQKGELIYRDVHLIRVNESESQEEKQCLVSVRLKGNQINIEVFMYLQEVKMTIIGNIGQQEMFENDPSSITFSERNFLISSMIDQLVVNKIDDSFQLKVDSDLQPMSEILKAREQELNKMPGLEIRKSQTISPTQLETLKRQQTNMIKIYEDKLREFESDKENYVQNNKAQMFQVYCVIGQRDTLQSSRSGLTLQLSIYVLLKKEKKSKGLNKRLSTYGKSQMQIEMQKLEQFMDDSVEVDQIYIETRDPNTGDLINVVLDKRKIVQILVQDFTADWTNILTNWRTQLVQYIQSNVDVDIENKTITVKNKIETSNVIQNYCKSVVGSKICQRSQNSIVDRFSEQCNELLSKTLVLNQEVDFTEYSYDVKLFKIQRNSNLSVGIETLAYHVEIFNLYDPDIVYKFRIPITHSSEPVSLFVEVINLIEFQSGKNKSETEISKHNKEIDESQNRNSNLDNMNQDDSESSQKDEQRTKVAPSKFEKLFKKYVDNQLVLIVQENKFPALISFVLVEPSSRLSMMANFEPDQEILQPAQFSLIDVGSVENFFTQVYEHMIIEQDTDNIELINWNQIPNISLYKFSDEVLLGQNHQIQVTKHRGQLIVKIQDKNLQDQNNTQIESPAPKITSEFTHQDEDVMVEEVASQLRGNYYEDQDSLPHNPNLVDIRLNDVFKMQLVSKVINLSDNGNNPVENLTIIVETNKNQITIIIRNLTSSEIVYCLILKHEQQDINDLAPVQVRKVQHIRQSFLDGIALLNGSHIAEEVLRRQQVADVEEQTNQLNRNYQFYQRNFNQVKTIGLSRKVFFDDTNEKIIIVTAEIDILMGVILSNDINQEVQQLYFSIQEPEKEFQLRLKFDIVDLIGQEEFERINKLNMLQLKEVAKNLLEKQATVKKLDNKDEYTVEFAILD